MPDERMTLAVPTESTRYFGEFTTWKNARPVVVNESRWLPRDRMERSLDWRQLIPTAVIRDEQGRLYTFRRVPNEPRPDLSSKVSLAIGGHPENRDRRIGRISVALRSCLVREIQEETKGLIQVPAFPSAVVIDQRTPETARHVAVIYEADTKDEIEIAAPEEFMPHTPANVRPLCLDELTGMIDELDPWTAILVKQWARDQREKVNQVSLF